MNRQELNEQEIKERLEHRFYPYKFEVFEGYHLDIHSFCNVIGIDGSGHSWDFIEKTVSRYVDNWDMDGEEYFKGKYYEDLPEHGFFMRLSCD